MATNPLIAQGTLNRLRGSLVITDHSSLNVTAPYLGKEGIGLSLEGDATGILPTMTGTVTSPEPYQICSVSVNLLKTNGLAARYKAQMEDNSVLGDITVIPDTSSLPNYPLRNCAIQSVQPLKLNGEDAGFTVNITGYYVINNSLWDLA